MIILFLGNFKKEFIFIDFFNFQIENSTFPRGLKPIVFKDFYPKAMGDPNKLILEYD